MNDASTDKPSASGIVTPTEHASALAAEMAMAAVNVQIAILQGMINAGLVDAKAMRAWLQSVVDDLQAGMPIPAQVFCLSRVIAHLDSQLADKRPLKLN
jgi:uncharacterized protein YgfB (UPF0149 family)